MGGLIRLLIAFSLSYQLIAASRSRALHVSTNYGTISTPSCKTRNTKLLTFLKNAERWPEEVHPQSTTYEEFILEMKESLDSKMLQDRAIHHLFSVDAEFYPYCDGDWMEFGVAYGSTINIAAKFRAQNCGQCPFVHGFDTFSGLPEKWKRDDTTQYESGAFDLEGTLPGVEPNVNLVKGLFNESLPKFLKKQAAYGAADSPLTFLHVDCDLYRGSADVFQLLHHKIFPGTVIVFDDLVNYQYYKEGEMKAWWEYLTASGAKFVTIGMLGPLPNKDYAMELSMEDGAHEWFHQSAAFVVTSVPGKTNPFEPSGASETRGITAEAFHRKREPIVQSTLEVLTSKEN